METLDLTKPISYFRDCQPIYFRLVKKISYKILVDPKISSIISSFQVQVSAEANIHTLKTPVAKKLGMEAFRLTFERPGPQESLNEESKSLETEK